MVINSNKFHYDPVANHYTTNLSEVVKTGKDLRHFFIGEERERIFLMTPETSLVAEFIIDHIEVSEESEVLYWELLPTTNAIEQHKRLFNAKMTIFND